MDMSAAQLNAVRYQEISYPDVATRKSGCDRRIDYTSSPCGESIRVPVSATSANLCQNHTGSACRCECLRSRNHPQRMLIHTRSWCFCNHNPRKRCLGSTNDLHHACVSLGSCFTPAWQEWRRLMRGIIAAYVLRLLGPLERQIVMNILWLDASIPASTMSSWVVREGKKSVLWIILRSDPFSCVLTC